MGWSRVRILDMNDFYFELSTTGLREGAIGGFKISLCYRASCGGFDGLVLGFKCDQLLKMIPFEPDKGSVLAS